MTGLSILIDFLLLQKQIKVDKTALDQQVEDKKFMEEMERKRSEAFGTYQNF